MRQTFIFRQIKQEKFCKNGINCYICKHKFRDVAQSGSVPVWGTGGRKFKSCHPDRLENQKTSKACKSNDLQAFLFLRCHKTPLKTIVYGTYPVTSNLFYLRGHRAAHKKLSR
jgi:hypothetical protein